MMTLNPVKDPQEACRLLHRALGRPKDTQYRATTGFPLALHDCGYQGHDPNYAGTKLGWIDVGKQRVLAGCCEECGDWYIYDHVNGKDRTSEEVPRSAETMRSDFWYWDRSESQDYRSRCRR